MGKAAQNAVLSAELAKRDFTAAESIFEETRIFFPSMGEKTDPQNLTSGLGRGFEIMANTIKIFACAGWRNSIVEALTVLGRRHNFTLYQIKEIIIWVWEDALKLPNYEKPRTGLEGKFSSQHAAAVALVDHAGGIEQFSDRRVADRELVRLRSSIRMKADSSLEPYQIRVAVNTVDGQTLSHFVPAQKGDPRNPVTWDELVSKFRATAGLVLPQPRVDAFLRMVQQLEHVKDIAALMRLCQVNSKCRPVESNSAAKEKKR